MATFTDATGRPWGLRITLGDLPRLRAVGFDLGAAVKDKGGLGLDQLGAALDDLDKLGQILWTLCESQAATRGVTPEQFATLFDGPALMAAQEGVAAAYLDFSQPRLTEKLKAGLKRQTEKTVGLATAALDQILSGSTGPDGSSPASPGSTGEATPSAN